MKNISDSLERKITLLYYKVKSISYLLKDLTFLTRHRKIFPIQGPNKKPKNPGVKIKLGFSVWLNLGIMNLTIH